MPHRRTSCTATRRGLNFPRVSRCRQAKLLGSQWKALDEKERVKFEKMASEAKAAIADAAPETKAKGKRANSEPKPSVSHRRTSCTATRRGRSFLLLLSRRSAGAQWKT